MSSPLDLNVNIHEREQVTRFKELARQLGLHGMATPENLPDIITTMDEFLVLKRYNLQGTTTTTMKKQLKRKRYQVAIVSAPLINIRVANWAAAESRVDLLTVTHPYSKLHLRGSTAGIAADTGTALEIPFFPVLTTTGLARAKIIKAFREAVKIALSAEMPIVITSAAEYPMAMRAPRAMECIGNLFGLSQHQARLAVVGTPSRIIATNEKKLGETFVADGIEIVRRDTE